MNSYNMIIETQYGLNTHCINTNIDLIEQYKASIVQGKGFIIWEDGIIDYTKIVGITRTPDYSKQTRS